MNNNEKNSYSTIAVWAPKPGDGASTTAQAAAFLLAKYKQKEEKLALLDFNLRTPTLKCRLMREEVNGIDDLLPYVRSGELSPEILLEIAVPIDKTNLYFVGGIRRPELLTRYTFEDMRTILTVSRELFNKIIIDAGDVLDNPGTIAALKGADLILAVFQPDDASAYCYENSVRLFNSLEINHKKVRAIVNRYSDDYEGHTEKITRIIDAPVIGKLIDLGEQIQRVSRDEVVIQALAKKRKNCYQKVLQETMQEINMLQPGTEKKRYSRSLPRFIAKVN